VFPPTCSSYTRLRPAQWHRSRGTKPPGWRPGDHAGLTSGWEPFAGAPGAVLSLGPAGPIELNRLAIDFALDGNEGVEELVGDVREHGRATGGDAILDDENMWIHGFSFLEGESQRIAPRRDPPP